MRNVSEIRNRRIFLFVTSRCLRSCRYCFMANCANVPDMQDKIRNRVLEFARLHEFQNITLIGGEPLLYPHIIMCIDEIITSGLKCSISTAGTKDTDLLNKILSYNLDDITISLDSKDSKVNDMLRGSGSYETALYTINTAIRNNHNVRVTTTVNRMNMNGIIDLAKYLEDLGVFQIDLHLMSYNGRAKENKNLGICPEEWVNIRKQLDSYNSTKIALSYPYIWVEKDCELSKKYYGYCEKNISDRISILPNGDIYKCTLSIGEEKPCGNIMNSFTQDISSQYILNKDGSCPCECLIGTPSTSEYAYICRFIKKKKICT